MASVKVNAKYTYAQGTDHLYCRTPTTFQSNNYCFDPIYGMGNYNVFMPAWALPTLGNNRNQRVRSCIRAKSVMMRLKITTGTKNLFSYNWNVDTLPITVPNAWDATANIGVWDDANNPVAINYKAMPRVPHQWVKLRLFIIRWDDDLKKMVKASTMNDWFYRNYCNFTSDWATPTNPDYEPTEDTEITYTPPAVELWSDVMRMTTPWGGKFHILLDKKLMLRKGKELDVNFKLPLNTDYQFLENSEEIRNPIISCFILGPRNVLTDVDPVTGSFMLSEPANTSHRLCQIQWWTKFRYIDL